MANFFQRAVTGASQQRQLTKTDTVEIPFDLNKLFSLTYEFQPLKECLEFIFQELKKNGDKIHQVDTKLVSKFMQMEK